LLHRAFKEHDFFGESPMPFKLSGSASRYRGEAVAAPDILLMIVAALSLWVLIVWAISSYL
jgi:hypothetical protein